jgi:hypothetical protein
MTDLTPIAPKLAKLLPRLATDAEGEVVATVAAIRRTLAGHGADLHDLAAAVTRPAVIVHHAPPPDDPHDWRGLAAWCRDNGRGRLTAKEFLFCRDMALRLILGGEPTERQAAWLRSIYAKLKGGEL